MLADIEPAKHHGDFTGRYTKLTGKKPHHVIGSLTGNRRRCDTDFELVAFRLANRILLRAGLAKDIDNECVAVPLAEGREKFPLLFLRCRL